MKRKAKKVEAKVKVVQAAPATLNARVYQLEQQNEAMSKAISQLGETMVSAVSALGGDISKLKKDIAELKRQVAA